MVTSITPYNGPGYSNFEALSRYETGDDKHQLVSRNAEATLDRYKGATLGRYSLNIVSTTSVNFAKYVLGPWIVGAWATAPSGGGIPLGPVIFTLGAGVAVWQIGKNAKYQAVQEYNAGIAAYGAAVATQQAHVMEMSTALTDRVTQVVATGDSNAIRELSERVQIVANEKLALFESTLRSEGFRRGDTASIMHPLKDVVATAVAMLGSQNSESSAKAIG